MRVSNLPDEAKSREHTLLNKRSMVSVAAIGLLLYIVIPQVSGLARSFSLLASADRLYVCMALVSVALTYSIAAYTYCLLSVHPLAYLRTLLVQISTAFVNRLLPVGLGGLGINVLYLKKQGHTLSEATAIAATNNFLGFAGNAVLVSIVLLFSSERLPPFAFPRLSSAVVTLLVVLIMSISVIALEHQGLHARLLKFITEMHGYMQLALARRKQTSAALLSAMLLAALYASALLYVLLALSIDFSWLQASLVVSLGSVLGVLLPTPGGLGGTEAGLLAGLVAYNVPAELAVAAVLIYRGLTYWLPLLPGFLAFQLVQKRYL